MKFSLIAKSLHCVHDLSIYITEPQLLLSCAVLACNLCVLCLDAAFAFADHMMLLTLDAQWLALCLLSVCIIYLFTSRLYSKTQNWTKNLFLSVFLLFSLLRSVKHPGPPYQHQLCQRRKLPPFRPQNPSPCLQHPF